MNNIVWPQNAPFAVCLTHDVDRFRKQWYHYGWYAARNGVSRQLRTLSQKFRGNDPYDNFKAVMRLEDGLGLRSTFLFLNETQRGLSPKFMGRYCIDDPRIVKIIRELDCGGWEIGLHGSYESYHNEKLLSAEKKHLENILGREVVSTRQHHLKLSDETWLIQSKIGLKYDSTVGFADKTEPSLFPYATPDGNMLELPMTVMDTLDLRDQEVKGKVWQAFDKACGAGGLFTVNFHQCRLNELENPHTWDIYREILTSAKGRGAYIATMGEIGRYLDKVCGTNESGL